VGASGHLRCSAKTACSWHAGAGRLEARGELEHRPDPTAAARSSGSIPAFCMPPQQPAAAKLTL
jgi:hypothetical protein